MYQSDEIEERLAAHRSTQGGKPTLKTIAQVSGLAVATVSRALSDAPDIGSDTKKIVRQIADNIGYVPNRAGVRLRTGRTNVISLVLSAEQNMMNHTARLISSLASGLRDTPFHMIITPFFPDQDPMVPVRYVVETRSADAVILNQTLPQDPRVRYLQAKGFPFATHGRTRLEKPHPYFDFDNVAFGKIAIGRLVERGCRRVVLIGPPHEHTYGEHLRLGATQAAQSAGIEVLDMVEITSDSMSDDVLRVMNKLLTEDALVDGVISASPGAAMAAVAAIESAGRTLGQGIHLVSKEAIPFLGLFRKEIITIREDVGRAGIFLSKAAIQAIQSPHDAPLQGLDVPTDNGICPLYDKTKITGA